MFHKATATILVSIFTAVCLSPIAYAERKRSPHTSGAHSSRADLLIDQAVAESKQQEEEKLSSPSTQVVAYSSTQTISTFPSAASIDTGPGPFDSSRPKTTGRRPIRGLIIAGSVLLAGTWGLTTSIALGLFDPKDSYYSAIPLVGPFVQLGHFRSDELKSILEPVLVLSGLWQFAGLGMLIGGAVGRPAAQSSQVSMQVIPMLSSGSNGLALVGSF